VRELSLKLDYQPLEQLLLTIEGESGRICRQILEENRCLFESAPGSTHNHQAWPGGYLDHITECMNYARHLYAFDAAFGRPIPFSLSEALLVLFLHDAEKPFRIRTAANGSFINRADASTKSAFKALRADLIHRYALCLSPAQHNALAYIEGEGEEYSSLHRVMGPLAAFCHRIDVWSARQYPDYPKACEDEWSGAKRYR